MLVRVMLCERQKIQLIVDFGHSYTKLTTSVEASHHNETPSTEVNYFDIF